MAVEKTELDLIVARHKEIKASLQSIEFFVKVLPNLLDRLRKVVPNPEIAALYEKVIVAAEEEIRKPKIGMLKNYCGGIENLIHSPHNKALRRSQLENLEEQHAVALSIVDYYSRLGRVTQRVLDLVRNKPTVMPQPGPGSEPEPGSEQRAERKPAAKPETRPEKRPETRPEARPEKRPETRPETRPEARPEARGTQRRGPQSEARPQQSAWESPLERQEKDASPAVKEWSETVRSMPKEVHRPAPRFSGMKQALLENTNAARNSLESRPKPPLEASPEPFPDRFPPGLSPEPALHSQQKGWRRSEPEKAQEEKTEGEVRVQPAAKKAVLLTEKLCKNFGEGEEGQQVLKDLTIEIYENDFTVIMGSSGSGKSTLLYALSGMDRPTSGTVRFFDKNIAQLSNNKLAIFRRKNCGFIFQQMFLLDNMSVLDNIVVSGLLTSSNRKQTVAFAQELLRKVGLTEKIWRKFPSQLSGGENQRAAIVRALINKPRVVFADEPTGALNSAAGQAVLDVLSDVNANGQSIVMVTHDLESARRGNRILYMRDGVIWGECKLGNYERDNQERNRKLQTFLAEMGW